MTFSHRVCYGSKGDPGAGVVCGNETSDDGYGCQDQGKDGAVKLVKQRRPEGKTDRMMQSCIDGMWRITVYDSNRLLVGLVELNRSTTTGAGSQHCRNIPSYQNPGIRVVFGVL